MAHRRYDTRYGRRSNHSAAPSTPGSVADERSYEVTLDVDTVPQNTTEEEYESDMEKTVDSSWRIEPFKQQILQMEIDQTLVNNTDHNTIISKLCDMGIKVYLLMHDSTNLKRDLNKMIEDASKDDAETANFNRCCLLKDENGRVFNIILAGSSSGLSSCWESSTSMFSGLNASVTMFILTRSLARIPTSADLGQGPLLLALFVSAVLKVEMSHSWICSQRNINGIPSISSVALSIPIFLSDVPRHLSVVALLLSAAATSLVYQKAFALVGVSLIVVTLAANLGGRAWRNAGFGPMRCSALGSAALGHIVSVIFGILIPVLGFRELEVGGQAALERSMIYSFIIAITFLASDIQPIQSYVVVGSNGNDSPQAIINAIMGVCWLVCAVSCLALAPLIKNGRKNFSEDKFLVKDENSPVGYTVPCLPNYYVEPHMIAKPFLSLPENFIKATGSFLTVAVGGGIICSGLFYPLSNLKCTLLHYGCDTR